MDTQLVMKIQDPGQCLLNSTALLFPLLLAFWCLPEESFHVYQRSQALPTVCSLPSPFVGRTLSISLI